MFLLEATSFHLEDTRKHSFLLYHHLLSFPVFMRRQLTLLWWVGGVTGEGNG